MADKELEVADESGISRRKDQHLDLVLGQDSSERRWTTWLEYVKLVPTSLPELSLDDVDLSVELFGRTFRAPILISGMTGGTPRGLEVNYALAQAAEALGIPFGVGSQRVMLADPSTKPTFDVKTVAPGVFLMGNIGAMELARRPIDAIAQMLESIRADALCVHLNPLQELVQPEGDREFLGALAAIREAVQELRVPIIVKEVGAGIGLETALRLRDAGVEYVDVAGAGGTSFVRVEATRAGRDDLAELDELAIPTAAAVLETRKAGVQVLASGGIGTGVQVAKALALGARACSIAGAVLRAYFSGGYDAVLEYVRGVVEVLRKAMAACGCRTVTQLSWAPRVYLGPLREWISQR